MSTQDLHEEAVAPHRRQLPPRLPHRRPGPPRRRDCRLRVFQGLRRRRPEEGYRWWHQYRYEASLQFSSFLVPGQVSPPDADAGGWLAALTAHHLQPPPLVLMSISGACTVHHPFFSSSTLLP